MKRCLAVLLACHVMLTALAPGHLNGAQIEGVTFRDECKIGDTRFVLNNVTLVRYQIVIKALVAGLYLGEKTKPADLFQDVPKRLELHYFWSLAGKDIVTASDKLLVQNLSPAKMTALREKIDLMNSFYEDVKAGDRYSLTYIPGKGTELALNGKKKGVVPGADFAAAYFTIWFGKKPMDVSMRDELLKPTSSR
ncbi:MAG TPA: chalcone isomerase family protein [Schlesneria sp.]